MPSPERDEKGLENLRRYMTKPRTLKEMAARTKQSERTVFRWIHYLEQDGAQVVSRRSGKGSLAHYWVIP